MLTIFDTWNIIVHKGGCNSMEDKIEWHEEEISRCKRLLYHAKKEYDDASVRWLNMRIKESRKRIKELKEKNSLKNE